MSYPWLLLEIYSVYCAICSVKLCLTISFTFPVEREHVQKKTFTKWVNSHLCRINCKVNDLYTDLRDGKLLLKLLEILSGERLVSRADNASFVYHISTFSIFSFA